MKKVNDIRNEFLLKRKNLEFIDDRSGQKIIEMLGASFVADEPSIFGKPSKTYIEREIDWYMSQSTNINDIYQEEREPPEAWRHSANTWGEINSNYGHLIFSEKYFNQYKNVMHELIKNPDGRRATMVYNRPSIWIEYNENGKSDFICTNAVSYYIRDGKLNCVVQMRSNDVVFGYKNDYAWQKYVLDSLVDDINKLTYSTYESGDMIWQVQNLHIYERHFHLLNEEE